MQNIQLEAFCSEFFPFFITGKTQQIIDGIRVSQTHIRNLRGNSGITGVVPLFSVKIIIVSITE